MAKTVILVDDNKDMSFLFCEYLAAEKNLRFELVGIAYDGMDAIDMIVSKQPDIVLLDIRMPKASGVKVMEKIRSMPIDKKPLFIIMTGVSPNNELVQKALEMGAVSCINKPFSIKKVISMLNNITA